MIILVVISIIFVAYLGIRTIELRQMDKQYIRYPKLKVNERKPKRNRILKKK